MRRFVANAIAVAALTLSSLPPALAQDKLPFQPLSDAEIRARTDKVIANQHANDEALEQYERVERHVDRTGGENPRILEDKYFRVVPTGPGTMKILLKTNGAATDSAEYRKQLLAWKNTLEIVLKPNDSRTKTAYAKAEKRKRDRADIVNGTREAFTVKLVARELVNGHDCDVIELTSNPSFRPRSTAQEALTHAVVKIWIDRNALQLVRGEARITHDMSFGGGLLGKLYRGGVFYLEQAEFAPGVWLPTRYQYDFTARKFLFTYEEHQFIEITHYRRIGSPEQALAVVRSELTNPKPIPGDP
jgi:hypothetical protein